MLQNAPLSSSVMGKPPKLKQIRIAKDVEPLLLAAMVESSRSAPAEVNHVLRKNYLARRLRLRAR
jgi:hypothetical protein